MIKAAKRKIWYILVAIPVIFVIYLIWPLPDILFPIDKSTVVLAEDGELLRVFLNSEEQWYFPPNPDEEIPEKLETALLSYEDKYFYHHIGINPGAILRAAKQNISHQERISGASTIHMQIARMMRHKPRTIPNKIVEMAIALKLNIHFTKNEILKIYLENAPFGGNIIGYQAASIKYFNKSPKYLSWGESAMLAVLPNAPGIISPQIDNKRLIEKRNQLLHKLYLEKKIDEEIYQAAQLEPVINGTFDFPFLAPHLASKLKRGSHENGEFIYTTIDAKMQDYIEYLLKDHLKYLASEGIKNGAVIVVDNRSGQVKAYVGSNNFFDESAAGQVDGVEAPRSSGSILKPFLYALAMDQGILLPQSLIIDVPTFYGSYTPTNATHSYDGLVTARDALVRSLNVPAVRLLKEYGINPFYQFLKNGGASHIFRRPEQYGLTMILGGAEVSLYDLAELYFGLSNGGIFQPLVITKAGLKSDDSQPGIQYQKQLISEGACYLTLDILKELKRPGAEYYWHQYQNQWPLAWKTGTSYGQRDAWAVGISPQWLIAVWIGNFSGESNTNLKGSKSAGTLLFDIFNYLPKDAGQSWFTIPDWDLDEIRICNETGYLATDDCPNTKSILSPISQKPLQKCPYHHSIYVTLDDQFQVCSRCWEVNNYKDIKIIEYPPNVAYYLNLRGNVPNHIPIHKQDCPCFAGNKSMEIVYPEENSYIWIPRDYDGSYQKIAFKAAHVHPELNIYWYLDHEYLGVTQKQHSMASDMKKGWHVLQIIDSNGQQDIRHFYVDVKYNLSSIN